MALIDFDKFLASFITEMKECSQMRNFSIPRCIKKALEEQGLEYKNGEIVKSQRRVSAETKENGYGESEDEKVKKELIKVFSNREKYLIDQSFGDITVSEILAWLEKQGQKPKEWSEEDETGLTNTIIMLKEGASLHFNKKDIAKAVNWLETIKQRIGG